MVLVGTGVHDEHYTVIVFNFLHRGFAGQREFYDVGSVHAVNLKQKSLDYGFPMVNIC